MKKLKYLFVLLLPFTVYLSFECGGWFTFIPVFVFFIVLPSFELILKPDTLNMDDNEKALAEKDLYFDFLMVSVALIHVLFCVYFLQRIGREMPVLDLIGRILSLGMMMGIIGINLGHELGHRSERLMQLVGEIMLTTSLENHFIPYHNRGHHLNVATPSDPATARLGEPLYLFWVRSHIGSYKQAWQNEFSRMKIMKKAKFGFNNKMVGATVANIVMLSLIAFFYGKFVLMCFFFAAVVGILLLETVNYIEHYGLLRKQRENGTYEMVKRSHSWNSNHIIGRCVLFELSRHSDHHFKADKPFQILETHDESPQMPTGYPGMMVLALIPPLFFKIMKPKVMAARAA